jgi:hypothetical protein
MRTTSLLCSHEGLQRHIDTVVAWLRKWRMAANTVKSQTMIIHPKANESASVAPSALLDPGRGGHQPVQRIQVFGDLVPGGWRWDHHADKALNKMRSAYGYWRPLLACARLPTRVRLLMLQTFVYSAVTGRGLGLYT